MECHNPEKYPAFLKNLLITSKEKPHHSHTINKVNWKTLIVKRESTMLKASRTRL
jgi:hypothetical protein